MVKPYPNAGKAHNGLTLSQSHNSKIPASKLKTKYLRSSTSGGQ